jgi:hypothetical protein
MSAISARRASSKDSGESTRNVTDRRLYHDTAARF